MSEVEELRAELAEIDARVEGARGIHRRNWVAERDLKIAEARLRKVEALVAGVADRRPGQQWISAISLRAALAAEPAKPCHPEHKAHPITGGRVGSVVPSGHGGKTWEPCPEPAEQRG